MIEGILSVNECLKLHDLAGQVCFDIVEIGSYKGKSTGCIASATKLPVYAIDLWDLRHYDFEPSVRVKQRGFYLAQTYKAFLENMKPFKNVIPVKGDSREIGKVWNRSIGLLFIDGNHSFDFVKSDYEKFGKYVVSGSGRIAFHDIVIKGVERVIEEIVKPSGQWTDFELTDTLWTARKL